MGSKGIVASTAAMGVLLQEGIGDTIRVSLTPQPGEAPAAPVFIDGEKALTLRGEGIAGEFHRIVESYIERRFGSAAVRA